MKNLQQRITLLLMIVMLSMSIGGISAVHANTLNGQTYVTRAACTAGAAAVQTPYEIDFGSFDSYSVFNTTKTNTGSVLTGSATPMPSNSPSVPASGLYLSVIDNCGGTARHADILASTLTDQNLFNSVTATAIPAANVKIQQVATVYYLGSTPSNSEITATSIASDTSISSATQLLQRTPAGNEGAGIFGVKPTWKLIIPAFQQPDKYQGTITWTIV